jgi:hypothetical protein
VFGGHLAENLLGRTAGRLGMVRRRPERRQLAEHHHLHPGKARHQDIQLVPHGIDVRVLHRDVHLDAGN